MKPRVKFNTLTVSLFCLSIAFSSQIIAKTNTILMFIAHEDVYYSEYIVMKSALEAVGYTVDVRSASSNDSSTYMIPANVTIQGTSNSLANSSHTQFTDQFLIAFNSPWDESLDVMPVNRLLSVDGDVQDVPDMSTYDALVVVGGTGALAYRVDGTYQAQGVIDASIIQNVAEKLNGLALDALSHDKPVMALCHGASVPVFWRIPGTVGSDDEALGFSLLKGGFATGFPDTPINYMLGLDVTPNDNDRVTISTPHSSFYDVFGSAEETGKSKILTTRDWYPQSVAFAAKALLNILDSYPSQEVLTQAIDTLIIHGGALDPNNCSFADRFTNDVPCNYGNTVNSLPADYTHLTSLLTATSANDNFSFNVSDINLYDPLNLPFDGDSYEEIYNYFTSFDSIVFFKHWPIGVTSSLQQALVDYADNGGTVIGLHHAAYNGQRTTSENKDDIVEMFGVESSTNFSATIENQRLLLGQYGHFISSYGMTSNAINTSVTNSFPDAGNSEFPEGANKSFSRHHYFSIEDEIYANWLLVSGQAFGTGINEITPLLKHDIDLGADNSPQNFSGLTKLFNPSLDETIGKVVFMMPGEKPENFAVAHPYAQMIRNAVAWLKLDNQPVNNDPIVFTNGFENL